MLDRHEEQLEDAGLVAASAGLGIVDVLAVAVDVAYEPEEA